MWGRDAAHLERMRTQGLNDRYLAAAPLGPSGVDFELDQAVQGLSPGHDRPLHAFGKCVRPSGLSGWVIGATKEVEHGSELHDGHLVRDDFWRARGLSGLPWPRVLKECHCHGGSCDQACDASAVQEMFHLPHFRVYTSSIALVWKWGALKNVIAWQPVCVRGLV